MTDKESIPKVNIGGRVGYRETDADTYIGNTDYRTHVKAIKTIGNTYYLRYDLDEYLQNHQLS